MNFIRSAIEKEISLTKPEFKVIQSLSDNVALITYKHSELSDCEECILRKLKNNELVDFYLPKYTTKYSFLPRVYYIFRDGQRREVAGHIYVIMEALVPYETSKGNDDMRQARLIGELEAFQIETRVNKLFISTSNLMMRENKEIVLVNTWRQEYSPDFWTADTIIGNRRAVERVLTVMRYKDEIKAFVEKTLSLLAKDNVSLSRYGLSDNWNTHYKNTNLPPSPMDLRLLFIVHKIHRAVRGVVKGMNQDIATYIPPMDTDDAPYWNIYNVTAKWYLKKVDKCSVIHEIVKEIKGYDYTDNQ